jgi:hypothetical protein
LPDLLSPAVPNGKDEARTPRRGVTCIPASLARAQAYGHHGARPLAWASPGRQSAGVAAARRLYRPSAAAQDTAVRAERITLAFRHRTPLIRLIMLAAE